MFTFFSTHRILLRWIVLIVPICILGFCTQKGIAKTVVNEVMWMGSDLSTADEWLELLYIPEEMGSGGVLEPESISLAGWSLNYLHTNGEEVSMLTFGDDIQLHAYQHFLISNYDEEHSRLEREPDLVTTSVSLPNTKLLLRLRDGEGVLIDEVDDGVGVPFAGINASGRDARKSMERIDPFQSGTLQNNWQTAETFSGFDDGARLYGTPGFENNFGPSEDIFPPQDAMAFTGSLLGGTLVLRWIPSTSLDLSSQKVRITSNFGSGSVHESLPASASGFTVLSLFSASGYTITLTSIDDLGNTSTGAVIILGEISSTSSSSSGESSSSSSASSDSSNSFQSFSSFQSSQPSLSSEASQSEAKEDQSFSSPDSSASLDSSASSQSSSSSGTTTISPPPILITEVLANPIGKDDHEWIEIGNFGTGAIDVAGWTLLGEQSSDHFVIPLSKTESGSQVSSGFILQSGEYRIFQSDITGISLRNSGERISLFSGSVLIDTWEYPETGEEVSVGRSVEDASVFLPFCVPTPAMLNQRIAFNPHISIQSTTGSYTASGTLVSPGRLTVNLEAAALSGSLATASCSWDFGDGFTSSSCNPPSHTFTQVGVYQIQLVVQTICGEQIYRSLAGEVRPQEGGVAGGGSTGESNEKPKQNACTPTHSFGAVLSEILPNPYTDEAEGEWIELMNTTADAISLCGWVLDDEEGGSTPYKLDGETIPPNGFLTLPREQTKISLNNDEDTVRLFAPGSENPAETVHYQKAVEGESFALRADALFVWTPFSTPDAVNKFRTAERRFPQDIVIVSAVLPNPVGLDTETEWIEISNVSDDLIDLSRWMLDDSDGGSPPFVLDGIRLEPKQMRRLGITETGLSLSNTEDFARLLDPDRYTVSLLSWTEAVEGRIYRPFYFAGESVPAKVVNVVDGDTIDIALTDIDHLDRIPESLKRRWIASSGKDQPSIRVRMIGIDTPETVHPLKAVEFFGKEASTFTKKYLDGAQVTLQFDQELWDKYNRLLAYVYLPSGELFQSIIVRHGLAHAYTRFPFGMKDAFLAYENEAKLAKIGLWSDEDVSTFIALGKEEVEEEKLLQEFGLKVSVDPAPGLVASGTLVTFSPNIRSQLFLSVDSGAFVSFSGSILIDHDTDLQVFAEATVSNVCDLLPEESGDSCFATQTIRSDTLHASYVLERESYSTDVLINEVYPSPASGEEEWIELYNSSDEDVPLAGWVLDDTPEEGSKPWVIPGGFTVPAHGFLVLSKEQTGLALNNDGDSVVLVSPDESVEVTIQYKSIKTGKSWVREGECVSDLPTVGLLNRCIQFLPEKNAPDEDNDLLPDDRETYIYGTSTTKNDSDDDGWFDGFEVLAAGTDPLVPTEETRELFQAYRGFALQYLKPSFRVYARKGLVITGKKFPLRALEVYLGEKPYPVSFDEDGTWEVIITDPLPLGMHSVDMIVQDTAGRRIALSNALRVELVDEYLGVSSAKTASAKKKTSTANSLPWLSERYRNVFTVSEENAGEPVSGIFAELAEQAMNTDVPSILVQTGSDSQGVPTEVVTVSLLMLFGLRFLKSIV